MIVNQPNTANQGQNQDPSIATYKNSRRVLLACVVAGVIISLVQYILTTINLCINYAPTGIWILLLDAIVFFFDLLLFLVTAGTSEETFNPFCSFWATNLVFQILDVACKTWIFWIDNNLMTDVLTWVKFALFVVILVLSIILYRKGQRNNDTIRYSNVESANVATNINDRGQVAIVGRRPQNQDYLAQSSVVSETLYDDLPPRYEDLDLPPTYEESLRLQQE